MLSPAEFKLVLDAVVDRLDPVRLEAHVTVCGRRVDSITVPVLWPVLAQRVLKHADDNAWLVALVDEIAGAPGVAQALVAACQRAREQWVLAQQAAEPFAPAGRRGAALVLFNKAPFVDRAAERPLVEEVVQLAGRRVLVVRGREAVGKSHLNYFVRHLVDGMPNTRMATLRLDEIEADLVSARDLMLALAASMDLVPDAAWDQMAQEARQADKLVRWLVGQTNTLVGSGMRWVIVLDTVNHAKVTPGATELITRLIMAAARGELANTSLIVLALPSQVPPSVAQDVMEQELPPLTAAELRSHVADLARTLGRAPSADALQAMSDFVLEGLQFPLDRASMDTVRRRVAQLYDEILRAAA